MKSTRLHSQLNSDGPVQNFSTEVLTEDRVPDEGELRRSDTNQPVPTTNDAHPLMKIERILQQAAKPDAHLARTVVVLPAFNVEDTLAKTVHALPDDLIDEIILVDDGSTDQTVRIARGLGLRIYRQTKSRGYGANLKMCYMRALERGGDFVIVHNPNALYDCRLVSSMIELLKSDACDMVIGSRLHDRREPVKGRIPLHKYAGNRVLTAMHNMILRQRMTDCFSGFRGFRRQVLKQIPYMRNSDGHVFNSQVLAQAVHFGYRIADLPSPGCSSDRSFSEDMTYGIDSLRVLASYCGHKTGLRKRSIFNS